MSEYAWKLNLTDDIEAGGVVYGPSEVTEDQKAQLDAGEGETYEILDDDENLYGTGNILGDYEGFEPLDDYGTPSLGAVGIKYKGEYL